MCINQTPINCIKSLFGKFEFLVQCLQQWITKGTVASNITVITINSYTDTFWLELFAPVCQAQPFAIRYHVMVLMLLIIDKMGS